MKDKLIEAIRNRKVVEVTYESKDKGLKTRVFLGLLYFVDLKIHYKFFLHRGPQFR